MLQCQEREGFPMWWEVTHRVALVPWAGLLLLAPTLEGQRSSCGLSAGTNPSQQMASVVGTLCVFCAVCQGSDAHSHKWSVCFTSIFHTAINLVLKSLHFKNLFTERFVAFLAWAERWRARKGNNDNLITTFQPAARRSQNTSQKILVGLPRFVNMSRRGGNGVTDHVLEWKSHVDNWLSGALKGESFLSNWGKAILDTGGILARCAYSPVRNNTILKALVLIFCLFTCFTAESNIMLLEK